MCTTEKPDIATDYELYSSVDPTGVFIAMLSEYQAFLTTADVAKILGCSKSTVCEMCLDGRLPNVPGSKGRTESSKRHVWRIPKISVIAYMAGKDTF